MRDALASMARNLAPDGLLVFDVNTLATYRTTFAAARSSTSATTSSPGAAWPERLRRGGDRPAGGRRLRPPGAALYGDERAHRERHYPVAAIESLAREAGLEIVDRRGQSPGVVLHPQIDEQRHSKALFLARRRRVR